MRNRRPTPEDRAARARRLLYALDLCECAHTRDRHYSQAGRMGCRDCASCSAYAWSGAR